MSKINTFTNPVVSAVLKALGYQDYPLLIDISSNNTVTDWPTVAKYAKGVIARCSAGTDFEDPKFADACQKSYNYGIPFGAYHYFRGEYYTQFPFPGSDEARKRWPSLEADQQFQRIIQTIRYKKIYWFFLDLEEKFNETVDPLWMSVGAQILAGRVADWLAVNKPGCRMGIYTRLSYLKDFAPGVENWAGQYDIFAAQWVHNAGNISVEWSSLKSYYPRDTAKFLWIANKKPRIVQWSGDLFHLPGIIGAVDCNLYLDTVENMYTDIGFVPGDVEPEPEPVAGEKWTAAANVLIRTAPNLNDATKTGSVLRKGEAVTALDYATCDGYNWVRHGRGWSAIGKSSLMEASKGR